MEHKHIAYLTAGHLFTDLNQGAVPALLPFLINEHGLSYAAAAGLVFATNAASSIAQPLFGHFSDKLSKPWMMPFGVLLAGIGIALAGIAPNYWLIVAALAISGLGVASFHPEAVRLANAVSGDKKATGISIFGVGGNGGFALGPILATTVVLFWGLKGTLFFLIPAIVMALLLFCQKRVFARFITSSSTKTSTLKSQYKDEWGPFSRLSTVVICRSTIFHGLNTFIPLYWIHVLSQSNTAGSTALTVLFGVGLIGTIIGGRLADRYGYTKVVRLGFTALIPLLVIFVTINDTRIMLGLLALVGFMLFAPYSPTIVLGQKYLPARMGLASGVTLGLAVSVGGVVVPGLGWIADHHGLQMSLYVITGVAFITSAMAFTLPIPRIDRIKKQILKA